MIAVALVVLLVALGLVLYPRPRTTPEAWPPPTPSPVPRDLLTPISVHVINRIDEATCTGDGGVPGPGNGKDWCYTLDEGFEVTRAQLVDLYLDMNNTHSVTVRLVPEDRAPYAAWTAKATGHQIAFVVADRVLEAPHLEMPIDGESIDFPSRTEADAQAIFKELWQ